MRQSVFKSVLNAHAVLQEMLCTSSYINELIALENVIWKENLPLFLRCPEALSVLFWLFPGVMESDLSSDEAFVLNPFRANILFRSASVSSSVERLRYSESGITAVVPLLEPPRGFLMNLLLWKSKSILRLYTKVAYSHPSYSLLSHFKH